MCRCSIYRYGIPGILQRLSYCHQIVHLHWNLYRSSDYMIKKIRTCCFIGDGFIKQQIFNHVRSLPYERRSKSVRRLRHSSLQYRSPSSTYAVLNNKFDEKFPLELGEISVSFSGRGGLLTPIAFIQIPNPNSISLTKPNFSEGSTRDPRLFQQKWKSTKSVELR